MEEVDAGLGDAGEFVGLAGGELGSAAEQVVDEYGVQVGIDRGRELAGLQAMGEHGSDDAADLLVMVPPGLLG